MYDMKIKKKRLLPIYLLLVTCFFSLFPAKPVMADDYWPAGPEVKAASAIVMEADTGAILYEKEIHAQHYPASITKIMTTLLALEHSSLQDTVTFSYDSIHNTEGSRVGFLNGEELSMENALYAVMLASANEGAYAVAEHVGGTIPDFVNMMNQRAAELGCTETHFSNPHGLPDETHVTSCHDMARIAREAYKNESFRRITKTVSYTIPATNKMAEERVIYNHHKMLRQGNFKYDACTGGKTGYTNAARNTLVTFAEKNGMALIAVIMQDDVSEDQYLDTAALLDFCFNNFTKIPVSESDLGLQLSSSGFFPIHSNPLATDAGKITLSSSACVILPKQASLENITSSVEFTSKSEEEIAQVNCSLDGHFIGSTSITFTPGKKPSKASTITPTEPPKESKPIPVKQILVVAFIVLCCLGFIGVVLYAIRNGLFEIDHTPKEAKMTRGKKVRRRPALPKQQPKSTVTNASVGSDHTPRLESEFSDIENNQERNRWTPTDFDDL